MLPHSRRALARLAFSACAAQLADRARARVPTCDDVVLRPCELLDEARSLVVPAQELLERAIVFERERSTSWAELGEVLAVSKQAAQQQHGQAVEDWTEGVNGALTVVDGRVDIPELIVGSTAKPALQRRKHRSMLTTISFLSAGRRSAG